MHNSRSKPEDIERLAAEAIGLGREVARAVRQLYCEQTSLDVAVVGCCLDLIEGRLPFDQDIDDSLAAIAETLTGGLKRECLGQEWVSILAGHDGDGPLYESEERPVYSERGLELLQLQTSFERFRSLRDKVLDHLAARRILTAYRC